MSATTQDRDTISKGDELASYPVKADEVIPQNVFVAIDANGLAVNGSDTAALQVVGVSRFRVDNTGGSDGDKRVEVKRRGVFKFDYGPGDADDSSVGTAVVIADNQTVTTSGVAANDIACGTISEVESASEVWVDIAR